MLKLRLSNAFFCLVCVSVAAVPAFGASNIEGKGLAVNAPTAARHYGKDRGGQLLFRQISWSRAPERLPVPPLVLRVRFQVSYHAVGNRPLILPLDHELTVWMSQGPGVMKILHQPAHLMDPSLKMMTHLPADVSADSPINPANDVFGVIPAGGDMIAPVEEEVTLQIYKRSLKQKIDLRGRRVYLKLQLDHQPLAPGLEGELSDRWSKFGAPWTGELRTNTLIFDVPAIPQAKECVAAGTPHPARQRL